MIERPFLSLFLLIVQATDTKHGHNNNKIGDIPISDKKKTVSRSLQHFINKKNRLTVQYHQKHIP